MSSHLQRWSDLSYVICVDTLLAKFNYTSDLGLTPPTPHPCCRMLRQEITVSPQPPSSMCHVLRWVVKIMFYSVV